ncbi:colicin immunity domain-containing protein [Domibacillus robiginosus]|uniref:colicin immunity domain-containing protein n=1 Tax=Domibacillus robiginosus TaxID=1071054 RepID=UPI00067A82E6|nr:colicin immunity domain-containing protein [Domibacillus robiginosus]
MSVYKCKKLIEDFLNDAISVEEFEQTYFETFLKKTGGLSDEIFRPLNDVFESVDCYWHECLPGQETAFEISEQQLREEVHEALVRLNKALDIYR